MPELMDNNVRVNIMGFVDELPEKTYLVTQKAIERNCSQYRHDIKFCFLIMDHSVK